MTDLDALIRERENGEWWKNRRTIDRAAADAWRSPRRSREQRQAALRGLNAQIMRERDQRRGQAS
jgi:hypothetical protein